MSETLHLMVESVEVVDWFLNHFATRIADYSLREITNGRIKDDVSVLDVHPLAMEMGNLVFGSADDNYKTVLPAIGVELQADPEVNPRLGRGMAKYKVVQDWIDEIKSNAEMKDRYTSGDYVTDEVLSKLQAALDALAAVPATEEDPLWADKVDVLHQPTISISIWSDDPQVTRILYKFCYALTHRARKELRRVGVGGMSINGNASLYSFDYGRMLVGAEITITPIMVMRLLEVTVDPSTVTLAEGELVYPDNTLVTPGSVNIGPKFVATGEGNET